MSIPFRHAASLLVALVALVACALASPAAAQDEASSPDAVPSSGWTWSSDIDVGWRELDLSGSKDVYRTIVDDGEGWRGFALAVDATRGLDRGRWADTLKIRGKGFGGDDDQRFGLTLGRRGTYKLELDLARTKGYFDIPGWQRGQHVSDRDRETAGIELTLYPKRATAWVSYRTRNTSGPGTTTQSQGSNQFLLLDERDADSQDLRIGGRIPLGPVSLTLEQAFRETDVVDDMSLAPGAEDGNQGTSTLSSYVRRTDASSSTNVSRIALQVPFKNRADLSLAWVYADGDGDEIARRDSMQVRPGPAGGIERLLESDATLDRLAHLLEAGLTIRLSKRLTFEDTFRSRSASSDGDVDQVATSIVNGNPTVSESTLLRRFEEDTQQNVLGLSWRGPHGVIVRAGLRSGSRELQWEEIDEDEAGRTSFDESRLFAGASWRPGRKIHLQGELETGNNDANDEDPKGLTRTLPTDTWAAGVRLFVTPREGTTVSFSLKLRDGENDEPPGTRDDETQTVAAAATHRFGDDADLRASLSRTIHDSSTLLRYTNDGELVDAVQHYELDNTTFRLDATIKPKARVRGAMLVAYSETDGSRPTRWYRVEPRLVVRATSHLGFDVGWYRARFDRPDAFGEDFTAEGFLASMRWSFGRGGEGAAPAASTKE